MITTCPMCGADVARKVASCPCCCARLDWYDAVKLELLPGQKSLPVEQYVGGAHWDHLGPPVHDQLNPATYDDALALVQRLFGDHGKLEVTTGCYTKLSAGYMDSNLRYSEVTWASSWAGLIAGLKPASVVRALNRACLSG